MVAGIKSASENLGSRNHRVIDDRFWSTSGSQAKPCLPSRNDHVVGVVGFRGAGCVVDHYIGQPFGDCGCRFDDRWQRGFGYAASRESGSEAYDIGSSDHENGG